MTVGGAVAVLTLYGLYAPSGHAFGLKNMYIWGILLGGILFGTGMAISGYFPGLRDGIERGSPRCALCCAGRNRRGPGVDIVSATAVGQWLGQHEQLRRDFDHREDDCRKHLINLFLPYDPVCRLTDSHLRGLPRDMLVQTCVFGPTARQTRHDEDNRF